MPIHGTRGSEPIGAALTIGIRGPRGFPVEKDRFHIMEPHEGANKRRAPHPSFAWFNGADPERRRIIRGIIVHATWDECLSQGYLAYRPNPAILSGPAPKMPNRRPWCTGDGRAASRYLERKGEWCEIACPGEACAHRKKAGPRPADCKPTTRFLFRLSFSGPVAERYSPPPLVAMFRSGGWHTYRALLGLRESLDRAALAMGIPDYSPMGYTFTLHLSEKSAEKQRFPVVTVSPSESPADFLIRAGSIRRQIVAAMPTATDEDARAISGGPGEV